MSYALTGLAPNTKYYFQVKAVSTGNAYTTYGSVLTFTTLNGPDRHHRRGDQRHGHGCHPQRHSQQREQPLDHGHLLL